MKNWKSTLAFFIFVSVYVYVIYKDMRPGVIDTAGFIALYSSLFMMFRSDFSKEAINKVIDIFGKRNG